MRKRLKTDIELYVINKVRERRVALDLSQDDLAFYLDTNRSFIGLVESPNSKAKYNLNHLNKLAKEMKCSLKDFMPDGYITEAVGKKNR
jgi:transcriptional regulator with XRE-family HTH domain